MTMFRQAIEERTWLATAYEMMRHLPPLHEPLSTSIVFVGRAR